MRVLFVTSEVYPLAKTGGLADVSRALPDALQRGGTDVRILLPGYPAALAQIEAPRIAARLPPVLGIAGATLVCGRLPGTNVPVYLVNAPCLYQREGGVYCAADGQDWADNAQRYAFLCHVAAKLATGRTTLSWKPHVVHANDWHAGLVPLLLAQESGLVPSTVFTAHNMAFQGNFHPGSLPSIGIPANCYANGDIEFYGQLSFLKAGLRYADRVTTVSPTYAGEVLTPEFGCGLDGLLRARGGNFTGILNGIDTTSWDPATDLHLRQTFHAGDIAGKRICKAELQRAFGLPLSPEAPLIGFVSRLTHQKMADTILEALPWLAGRGAQFALLGEGARVLEAEFLRAQDRLEAHVSVRIGYDEAVAHRLQAGCDLLLAPARFEPCGLTQLYALRYGTLPVVRRTGGLADTVVDATAETIAKRTATGFVFDDSTVDALVGVLDRALTLFREPLAWRLLQLQAMAQDFSWEASAARYLALYCEAEREPLRPTDGFTSALEPAGQLARQAAL